MASERAAYTVEELTRLARAAGLGELSTARARPLGEQQVRWVSQRGQEAPGAGLWRDVPLPAGTRLPYRIVAGSFPRALQAT